MSNTAQLEIDLLDADRVEPDAEFLADDELLIEEISIDGMCGVY
jgi:mycofactocin precursor